MEQQCLSSNDTIEQMLIEVNKVLKVHLNTLLNPIILEKNNLKNLLLEIPFVKDLFTENADIKEKNAALLIINHLLRKTLQKKNNIIKTISKKLDKLGKGSMQLEVTEINSPKLSVKNFEKKCNNINCKINEIENLQDDEEEYISDDENIIENCLIYKIYKTVPNIEHIQKNAYIENIGKSPNI